MAVLLLLWHGHSFKHSFRLQYGIVFWLAIKFDGWSICIYAVYLLLNILWFLLFQKGWVKQSGKRMLLFMLWRLTNVSLLHSLFFCPSPVSISCGGIALFRVRAQSKGLPKKAKSKLSQDKYKAVGTSHKKHIGRPKNKRFSHPFGALHCKAVWTFPQKCAPSGGRIRPITRSLRKDTKVKVNAQGYSHLPTHLMVSVDRYDNYLSKKVSLGTQIFIFCQIWQFKKQYYEKVNKFWLVSYEIEQAPTYEKSHSAPRVS